MRHFDRVKETATTTGTGNFTLAGAVTQFLAFSAVYSAGDENVPYAIVGQSGSEWEVGIGTYVSSNTLRRDTIIASSNSNAAVNFSSGTKDVFVTIPNRTANPYGRIVAMQSGQFIS